MRKPKRLIGYVKYDESDYPFEFNEETFSLLLFPPTVEVWAHTSSIFNLLSGFKDDGRKHEWIGVQQLHGITSERNKIIFEVSEARGNYNGFYNYSVNWYFYHSAELDPNAIDGFKVSGEEVNYFFPPQQVLKPKVQFNDDHISVNKMAIEVMNQITKPCGKYRIAPHVDAIMEVSAYGTMHFNTFEKPMDATSMLITSFSQPANLTSLLIAFRNLRCFFEYIVYRTNVNIHSADIFRLNNQEKRDYQGLLVFKRRSNPETSKTIEKVC